MLVNGKRVNVFDPDLSRLLGETPPRKVLDYDGHTPVVDKNRCTGCGVCAKKCIAKCITLQSLVAHVNESLCRQCGICIQFCPFGGMR